MLGSGVAGLSAAVRAADTHGMRVGVLTKGELHQATTRWAQGGVAAVLAEDPDSTDLHLADTLAAGAGLCDADAVRVLVDEGPGRVNELIALGAIFDRDEQGQLELAREGGHSLARVVHAGGAATGVEIERALVDGGAPHGGRAPRARVRARPASWRAAAASASLAVDGAGRRVEIRASHVLLATGGAGQLFAVTTNPVESHRRRHRHGPAGRGGGGRRRVRAVPPDRAAPPADAAPAAVRGARGATARCCATPRVSGSSTSCCRATRCRGP